MIITIVNLVLATFVIWAILSIVYEDWQYLLFSAAFSISLIGLLIGYVIRDVYYVGTLAAEWNSRTHGDLIRFWSQPLVAFSTALLVYTIRYYLREIRYFKISEGIKNERIAELETNNAMLREALHNHGTTSD